MGMTIEFFSAKPHEIFELFSTREVDRNLDAFFDKLETYPVADFSFHMHVPEDMDNLCKILRKRSFLIPPLFYGLLAAQIWSDSISESIWFLIDSFVNALAMMSEAEIEAVALEWAATFPYQEPLKNTSAYQAVIHLRAIAVDAHMKKQSLLFYLDGDPAFFHW